VRLLLSDAPEDLVVPFLILSVLQLILGLIHCHMRIGADVALHKPRDDLQVSAKLGLLLYQPGRVAAFSHGIFADLDDLVLA
jgi:hypothetical protein